MHTVYIVYRLFAHEALLQLPELSSVDIEDRIHEIVSNMQKIVQLVLIGDA